MPTIPNVSAQYVIDLVDNILGGYANAKNFQEKLDLVNEGKNELWIEMKEMREDYFLEYSQNSDDNKVNFFADLTVADRRFTLPRDFHQMKAIQVLTPGKEGVEFNPRDLASEEYRDAYRSNTPSSSSSGARAEYLYDIIGKRTLALAQFPETTFNLELAYIRSLPDLTEETELDELIFPFAQKVAIYAAKLITLSLQDRSMTDELRVEWKNSLRSVELASKPRTIAGTKVVEDWQGWPTN